MFYLLIYLIIHNVSFWVVQQSILYLCFEKCYTNKDIIILLLIIIFIGALQQICMIKHAIQQIRTQTG